MNNKQQDIFGLSFRFASSRFVEVKTKNIYLIGRWFQDGKNFDVYVGRDGIKIVPYNQDVFVSLIFSLVAEDTGKKVFVDGSPKGFCVIYVVSGRVREIFIFRREATSNSNELEAVKFALNRFRLVPVFSDSSYAIRKSSSNRLRKVRSHSGVLWNCIPDYILQNL